MCPLFGGSTVIAMAAWDRVTYWTVSTLLACMCICLQLLYKDVTKLCLVAVTDFVVCYYSSSIHVLQSR